MPFMYWPEVFDAALNMPEPDPLTTREYGSAPRRSVIMRRDVRDYHHPEPRHGDEVGPSPQDEPIEPPAFRTVTRKDDDAP
jgi:hypothetical protein